MEFEQYQRLAASTAIYPQIFKVVYPVIGLSGEVGEVSEKVKKSIRDGYSLAEPDKKEAIKRELGDVLWYIAAICTDLDLSMNDVAATNISKLAERKENNTLQGSGDNR